MQTHEVVKFRQVVIQLSQITQARMNDMNHLILTFDQVSASMFILKDNMIKGTTEGIAIIKELNKMAVDVEGARTGFIAADNKGSTLFRGDDVLLPNKSNVKQAGTVLMAASMGATLSGLGTGAEAILSTATETAEGLGEGLLGASKLAGTLGVAYATWSANPPSVGESPGEEEAGIKEYYRRQISKVVAGMPEKWPWSALPSEGSYPFIPPTDKANKPVIKKSRQPAGLIDDNGNIWSKDKPAERVGNSHWDVQLKDGSHLNVNGDDVENPGEINHGKSK